MDKTMNHLYFKLMTQQPLSMQLHRRGRMMKGEWKVLDELVMEKTDLPHEERLLSQELLVKWIHLFCR